jgi:hypothetical protein
VDNALREENENAGALTAPQKTAASPASATSVPIKRKGAPLGRADAFANALVTQLDDKGEAAPSVQKMLVQSFRLP